jgi:hypothetical protein
MLPIRRDLQGVLARASRDLRSREVPRRHLADLGPLGYCILPAIAALQPNLEAGFRRQKIALSAPSRERRRARSEKHRGTAHRCRPRHVLTAAVPLTERIPIVRAPGWSRRGSAPITVAAGPAVAAAGYSALRGLERRAIKNLPTVAELARAPLPRLYRMSIHAERARLRRQRVASEAPPAVRLANAIHDKIKLVRMRELGLVPTPGYQAVRVEQMLERAMRARDDIVDGHARPTVGTRDELFARTTWLLAGFDRPHALTEAAQPEDLALIYALLASRRDRDCGLRRIL